MNAQTRREKIVQFVNANGEVSFSAIKSILPDVSDMTIRRDLDFLGQNNALIRVFGGAKSIDLFVGASEAAYAKRSIDHVASKEIIARKATSLIKNDSVIFLGSGTTTTELAKIVPNGRYYVVTTGLNCAIELSSRPDVSVIMVGGSVNKNSFCVNGTMASTMIEDMHFSLALLGTSGYLIGKGFTTSVAEDYMIRKQVVEQSDCTAILMDSSKYGKVGSNLLTFVKTGRVTYLVSDDDLPAKARDEMELNGVTVL